MIQRILLTCGMAITLLLAAACPSNAWNDRTHMAVVEAAGLPQMAYMAVGADMAKEKAPDEMRNHYRNNDKGAVITAEMVLAQVPQYNKPEPYIGHLYGAIVASVESFREKKKNPAKYAWYPLGYAMHYIGDLSMPFHNIDYDPFSRDNHGINDAVVENEPNLTAEIRSRMAKYPVRIDAKDFRQSLAAEVGRIATRSIAAGYRLKELNTPLMSKETAYDQLAQSAALLRAILISLEVAVGP